MISLLPVGRDIAGMDHGSVLVLLFVPLGLPWMIRHLFKTSRLDEPMDHWIAELIWTLLD